MELLTLAAKLGTTAHLSSLLHRAQRLGLGPRELEILAVQRGVPPLFEWLGACRAPGL